MKITVNKNELIKQLTQLTMIVQDNKIRPALSNVLLKADNNIELIGTDLEQTLIIDIDGEIEEAGKVIINHKEILEFLKLSDEEDIIIKSEGTEIKIENMTFSTYDSDEYPDIKFVELEKGKINKMEFVDHLKSAMFAAGIELDKPEVNCVRIDNNGFTSTDRYRMVNIDCVNPLEADTSIPLRSAVNISKLLETSDSIEFIAEIMQNKIYIEVGNYKYMSRLVDLPYPDIKSIIDAQITDKKAIIEIKQFKKILKKVLIVARNNIEGKNAAIFTFDNGKLEIYAEANKTKIKEKVEILYTGEKLKTMLNCKYILDYVEHITGMLEINFSNNNSAFTLVEEGKENYKYLMSPLAVRSED